jgi:hypothetical protein
MKWFMGKKRVYHWKKKYLWWKAYSSLATCCLLTDINCLVRNNQPVIPVLQISYKDQAIMFDYNVICCDYSYQF